MTKTGFSVVTGAFGFTGSHIARRLSDMGVSVRTLTGHPGRPNQLGQSVEVAPLDFSDPDGLARNLEGASTLYNTYWVRFSRGSTTFDSAVANSTVLIQAAKRAGVGRLVHISITNADSQSPVAYFRGKGQVEDAIRRSRLSYAIVRPSVLFGGGDVLINNITWFLRRFPVFTVLGSGEYRLQPVFVGDVASIAVDAASGPDDLVVDAVGPETFTFNTLLHLLLEKTGSRARLIHVPPSLALLLTRLVGLAVGDVVLTRGEVEGLMQSLLTSDAPPTGPTRLSDWLSDNAETVGTRYTSELQRHYR